MDISFDSLLSIEGLILALVVVAFGEKLKPLANFFLRMFGRKPMNGGSNWMTLTDYNSRRPDWFIDWEKRHDKTHDNIGSSIKEVKEAVTNLDKKFEDKISPIAETVIRIDERDKLRKE